ncbi:Transcriptional protein SWT1 [Pichia kudriavzevii]|uniref:Transcriptional protein SWT1 n=1 Tax=Pichia kudriavzevii TaxID=4909 RepID=A0A1V2LNV6_PICKU|nr:Transcriptional protein SWT1 [Pichia kudriavzevii]
MNIQDEEHLSAISDCVLDLRENNVFVPTDKSLGTADSGKYHKFHKSAYLVVDTNFILSHLAILEDLENLSHDKYAGCYQIVIPKQVIHELDGLKDSDKSVLTSRHSISKLARSAIDWCYAHFHESVPTVTGQRLHERIDVDATKDDSILDCCLYFQNVENGGGNFVVLMSDDKNLCVKALVNNVLTVSYRTGMDAELIASNIVNELQLLNSVIANEPCILEAINYAINSTYGDDVYMIEYDESKMKTLRDAGKCILRLGFSTFADFFDRRNVYNPMQILKDRTEFRKFTNVPPSKKDLDEFVEFWKLFLEAIYKSRNVEQKNALKAIEDYWARSMRSTD